MKVFFLGYDETVFFQVQASDVELTCPDYTELKFVEHYSFSLSVANRPLFKEWITLSGV